MAQANLLENWDTRRHGGKRIDKKTETWVNVERVVLFLVTTPPSAQIRSCLTRLFVRSFVCLPRLARGHNRLALNFCAASLRFQSEVVTYHFGYVETLRPDKYVIPKAVVLVLVVGWQSLLNCVASRPHISEGLLLLLVFVPVML
jgi:hypothetical protein